MEKFVLCATTVARVAHNSVSRRFPVKAQPGPRIRIDDFGQRDASARPSTLSQPSRNPRPLTRRLAVTRATFALSKAHLPNPRLPSLLPSFLPSCTPFLSSRFLPIAQSVSCKRRCQRIVVVVADHVANSYGDAEQNSICLEKGASGELSAPTEVSRYPSRQSVRVDSKNHLRVAASFLQATRSRLISRKNCGIISQRPWRVSHD